MAEVDPARPLVIGVGNPFAGDDAVGRLVASRLMDADGDFDVVETHGIATDLVVLFENRPHVILIDACKSGAAPGTLHHFDVAAAPLPPSLQTVSSHGIGVVEALELARTLSLLPPRCQVIAIEGASFGLGAPVSENVKTAVDLCVNQVIEMLG